MYESVTLSLTGDKYSLSTNYFPPINVYNDSKIALYSLKMTSTYDVNNIKYVNIDDTNNQIQFNYIDDWNGGLLLTLKHGVYTFDGLVNLILKALSLENKQLKGKEIEFHMFLKNDGRCSMWCSHYVDFNIKNSLSSVLGFQQKEYRKKINYKSKSAVNVFNPIKSIKVLCNIVQDSFINERSSHIIYEFFPPSIKEKSKGNEIIIENPPYLAYYSLNTTVINSINIQLVDQDLKPIHTSNSNKISIVLHIKRCRT